VGGLALVDKNKFQESAFSIRSFWFDILDYFSRPSGYFGNFPAGQGK